MVQSNAFVIPIPHQLLVVGSPGPEQAKLQKGLDSRGFHVTLAKDGGQAHASFAMRKPDLVLMEILLPGESGFEVCEWMKRTEPGIPVVFLTVVDMPDARELAEQVGADDYVVSPCDLDALEERIKLANEAVWTKTHTEQPKELGRVHFQCRCGKRLKVSTSHRGKSMTCPKCGEPLIVPRHD